MVFEFIFTSFQWKDLSVYYSPSFLETENGSSVKNLWGVSGFNSTHKQLGNHLSVLKTSKNLNELKNYQFF